MGKGANRITIRKNSLIEGCFFVVKLCDTMSQGGKENFTTRCRKVPASDFRIGKEVHIGQSCRVAGLDRFGEPYP